MHIRVTLASCAVLLALLWPAAPVSSHEGTGRIAGTVTLMAPAPPLQSGAYSPRRVTRRAPLPSEMANVIVFVKDAPPMTDVPVSRASIFQRGESFVPRVAAITRGSTVDFPNFDPFFHNVFSLSRGSSFDLGRYPRGSSRSRTFTKPGLVKVYCQLHSEMSAAIMVFDHTLFAVPGPDGRFELDHVPAGRYRLSAWHERIGEQVTTLEVAPGGTTHASFALPVEDR